jgi:hypothetical protein
MHKSSHRPKEGYFLEIDEKFESEYGTLTGGIESRLATNTKTQKP